MRTRTKTRLVQGLPRTHAAPHPIDPQLGGAGRRQYLAGREPPPNGTKQPPPRPTPLLPAARSQVPPDGQCACAAAAGRRGAERSAEPSRWGPPAGGRWRSRGRRGAPRGRQVSVARPCQVPGTAAPSPRPLPSSTRGTPRAPARVAPLPAGAAISGPGRGFLGGAGAGCVVRHVLAMGGFCEPGRPRVRL